MASTGSLAQREHRGGQTSELTAQLADELALCGHEEITAIDILDALASVGLKLMPDMEGDSSQEYMDAHKSVIRSAKDDLN